MIDMFYLNRGVGCIFVEMITGVAMFPGMRDSIDQLNKIWQVRQHFYAQTTSTSVQLETILGLIEHFKVFLNHQAESRLV